MLKFLADENFDNAILRGLLRRRSTIDIVRVQDTELYGANDPMVLAWAAQEDRVLLTHDVSTITRYAYERVAKEQTMPGVIEVIAGSQVGQVIEDLLLLLECLEDGELANQIYYLPF
jgi:predicted nuclease of predicted toxin-antitoxin system